MRVEGGNLVVGSIQGAPVRLHWSLLVVPIVFSRFHWMPVTWITWTLLVLIHEVGHLAMVRRFGFPVLEIMVHGMGGHCTWQGRATPIQRAWIASGGVLAQLVVLAVALIVFAVWPVATLPAWAWELREVLIWSNLWGIGFNLLPMPPLDGVEALKLPGLLWAQRSRRLEAAAQKAARAAQKQADRDLRDQDAREVPPEVVAEVDQLLAEVGIRRPPPRDPEP